MCRLLAYTTKKPAESTAQLIEALKEFRTLAVKGCVPCGSEPGHNDGWGISAYKDGAVALYYRSIKPAGEDVEFENMLKTITDIQPELLIAHLRKTSMGGNVMINTQPFVSDLYTFCHNGTIEMEKQKISDSLRFFRDVMEKHRGDQYAFVNAHREMAEMYDYTAMNMFFCDGEKITVVEDYNESHPKAEELGFEKYYTLWEMKGENACFVCSEPLNSLGDFAKNPLENKHFYYFAEGVGTEVTEPYDY